MRIISALLFIALLTMSAQAQKLWTGGGGDGLWTTATNWSGGTVPTSADSVVLDNTTVSGSYTVTIPLTGTAIVKELQIGYPGNTNTITLYFSSNATTAGLKIGDGAAGNLDFDIDQGGVFINASNAASGSTYFQRANASDSLRVKSGGKFVEVTSLSFSTPFPATTTKFDEGSTFELNVRGTGLATPTVSGRTYGNYTLAADSSGGTRTYQSTSGASAFKVLDTWTVKSGVTLLPWGGTGVDSINNISNSGVMSFAPASGSLYIYGNLTVNDSFIVSSATLPCTFNGSSSQMISGTGLIEFKDSVIMSNTVAGGVTLPVTLIDSGSVTNTGILTAGMSGSITGSGSFRLYPGGTLYLSGPNGVNDLVKTTGTKSLSSGAKFYFDGGGPQVTGTLMPDTVAELKTFTSTGLTLSKTTVANTVTLTGAGSIITTGDTLIAPNGIGGSYGGGAYIAGNLSYNVTSIGAWVFPVGSGLSSYLPTEIDFSSLTGSGAVVVGAVDSTVTAPPPLSQGYSIKKLLHYFQIGNASGITNFAANIIFGYTSSDMTSAGIANDSTLHVYQYAGTKWLDLPIASRDVTNKRITVSGVSSFGTFILAAGPKTVTIAQAKVDNNHDFVPDYSITGDTLIVYGVVTSPNLGSTYTSYFIQDATGGIDVYKGGTIMPFSIGDSVFVIGKILQNKGVEEISPLAADSLHFGLLKHNATVPSPTVLTLHNYNQNSESYEGSLIEIDSLYKVSGTWGANQSILVMNPAHTDTATMYINSYTNVGGHAEPNYPINLVGIASQYSSSTPPNNGYEIIPRDTNDVKSVATVPSVPTVATPPNNATNMSPNVLLSCHKVATATNYHWQLSTSPTFASFVVNDSTTDTSRAVTSLAYSTKYYWKVRAINSTGASAFAGPDSFTTMIAPPSAPTLLGLGGAAYQRADTLVLKWHPSSSSTKYLFQLSTVRAFSSYVVADSNVTDTTRKVTGLSNSTMYFWRVSGYNTTGFGSFSSIDSFTTIMAVPVKPTLGTPASGAAGIPRRATLTWNPSTNAAKYHLQVATDSAFSTVVLDTTLVDTSKKLGNPLAATTKHYWRVSGIDTAGAGSYSTIASFTTGVGIDAVAGYDGIPKEFALNQNYPNPFNPSTTISYDLPKNAFVNVIIYDILGREVATLVNGVQQASHQTVKWNPSGLSSGIYFCRIHAESQDGSGSFTSVKKLVYMK